MSNVIELLKASAIGPYHDIAIDAISEIQSLQIKLSIAEKKSEPMNCANENCGWNSRKGKCGLIQCCPGRNR